MFTPSVKICSMRKNAFLEGLEEPFSKRTVEGDLGMRYSALSVWENFSKSPDFLEETGGNSPVCFGKLILIL